MLGGVSGLYSKQYDTIQPTTSYHHTISFVTSSDTHICNPVTHLLLPLKHTDPTHTIRRDNSSSFRQTNPLYRLSISRYL